MSRQVPEQDEFDDLGFQRRLAELGKARARARRILGVAVGDGDDAIRAAYRRQAKLCHPDRAKADPAAHRRFLRVRAAYELLAHGKQSALLAAEGTPPQTEQTEKYSTDSEWGHFLWWREKFSGKW